jgi:hypothetical protein
MTELRGRNRHTGYTYDLKGMVENLRTDVDVLGWWCLGLTVAVVALAVAVIV